VGQAQLLFIFSAAAGGGAFCEAKDYNCLLLLQNTKSGSIFSETVAAGARARRKGVWGNSAAPERSIVIVPRVARLSVIFYKFLLKYVRAWL
jgi:hypothetical protein